MRVTVLHDRLGADAGADELDVLDQVRAVTAALATCGHDFEVLACDLNASAWIAELRRRRPDVVFNLVETIAGQGRLLHFAPAVLESIDMPFTGASATASFVTAGKLLSKRLLVAAGLPTPPWLAADDPLSPLAAAGSWPLDRFVIKSVWEHGSLGLEDDCVVEATDAESLYSDIARLADRLGGEAMAERYVHGREFNVTLLANGDEIEVLAPAELEFRFEDPEAPRIVGWRSKWQTDSPEFDATVRRFPTSLADRPLLAELTDLARRAWLLCGLRGYARVDFRVDPAGRPTILEVNSNPCLAPDAGFAAALSHAGIPFHTAIARILDATPDRVPV